MATDPPQPAEPAEESEEQSSRVQLWLVVLAVLVVGGVVEVIIYGYLERPGWIGSSGKQFWDYLDLLIVPAALALGVYWLNRRQTERDQQAEDAQQERALAVESQRAQDEALQAYLDQMSQLLTDKDRPLHRAQPGDGLSTIAWAWTKSVLRRMDPERKGNVLRFVNEAGLINKNHQVFRLSGADLRGVNLRESFLRDANMRGADLSGANMREANLIDADLSGADLSGADLTEAKLGGASLVDANLTSSEEFRRYDYSLPSLEQHGIHSSLAKIWPCTLVGADLSHAHLERANLAGANLDRVNLAYANLRGATFSGYPAIVEEKGIGIVVSSPTSVDHWLATLSGDSRRFDHGPASLYEAELSHANLQSAELSEADLSRADLSYANLQDASLRHANLQDANLDGANLAGAQLVPYEWLLPAYEKGISNEAVERLAEQLACSLIEQQPYSLEGTIMPNGQKYEEWLKSKNREEDG